MKHIIWSEETFRKAQKQDFNVSKDDRILKQLCLKITGNYHADGDTFNYKSVISMAKNLYNELKKDGWL